MLVLIIGLFLIASAESILNIDPSTNLSTVQSLNMCAAELCRNYFRDQFHKSVIVIFENSTEDIPFRSLLLKELSNEKKLYYILTLSRRIPYFRKKYTGILKYILLEMSSLDKLKKSISTMRILPGWNPKAIFLIVSFTVFENSEVIANTIFKLLLKEDIVPIAVLLIDQNNTKDFNIFTTVLNSEASTSIACRQVVKEDTIIYSETAFSDNTFKTVRAKFYPFPPFVIHNGTSFDMKHPGIEINLLQTLAQTCNLNVEYYLSDPKDTKGEVFQNGTLTKDFKELHENKYDVILGGYVITYPRSLYLNPSVTYSTDELIWCVPNSQYYKYNINIKRVVLLVGLLIFVVLVVFIWYANIRKEPRLKFGTSIEGIILNSFSICVFVPIPRLPKTGRLRYLVGLLIIFAFFCTTMFNTTITSLFIGKAPSQRFDSMEKIYKSNLKTYYTTNTFHYFTDLLIPGITKEELAKRKIDCSDTLTCLKIVAEGDSALVISKYNVEYLMTMREVDHTSIYRFHFGNDRPLGLIMRKGFRHADKFNKIIHLLLSKGIVQKWNRDIFWNRRYETTKQDFQRLNLKELAVVFYVLVFGCSCSFLMFVCEILTRNFMSKLKH
ncbi:Ionotropic receptor 118 [Diabrotica virgifera virgifera]|nr:Ionotropic receptor 118 [Diabrotica virgifera virgifera]